MRAAGERPLEAIVKAPEPNYLPGQLLYALAIENAVKGLCVATNATLIGEDRLDAFLTHGHDLNQLIVGTEIELSDPDSQFLGKLTHIIQWAGRYPVAKNIAKHKEATHPIHSPDQILGPPKVANERSRELFALLIQESNRHASDNDDDFGVLVDWAD